MGDVVLGVVDVEGGRCCEDCRDIELTEEDDIGGGVVVAKIQVSVLGGGGPDLMDVFGA